MLGRWPAPRSTKTGELDPSYSLHVPEQGNPTAARAAASLPVAGEPTRKRAPGQRTGLPVPLGSITAARRRRRADAATGKARAGTSHPQPNSEPGRHSPQSLVTAAHVKKPLPPQNTTKSAVTHAPSARRKPHPQHLCAADGARAGLPTRFGSTG